VSHLDGRDVLAWSGIPAEVGILLRLQRRINSQSVALEGQRRSRVVGHTCRGWDTAAPVEKDNLRKGRHSDARSRKTKVSHLDGQRRSSVVGHTFRRWDTVAT